jgi:outer membrane protein OmpA-like peptidoglycan-associated protein
MEFTMFNKKFFPMTLIAVAILSGCSSMPQNSALSQAQNSYDNARAYPQVSSLAPLELKEASESLNKADNALSQGESDARVTHLAYIAKRKAEIALETAKRKTDELVVTNAATKRNELQLAARTAEADTAKQQTAIVQNTANQQAVALAAASANTERDQALIAQQDAQLNALNAKKTERGMVITLGNMLFSTDKAHMSSGGMRNVQKLADFLKQYPKYKVLIEGYTDSTGSDSLNQELSDRRANSVRTALIDMGIDSDRVTARGYGKAFPVTTNNTAAGRQLNRRVEIVLSDSQGNIGPR